MANLNAILEYQDVDIKLRRALDSIEKSDAAKRGKQAKTAFETAKKSVDDSERAAGEVVEFMESAGNFAKESKAKVAEYREKAKSDMTSKERKQMISELEALKKELSETEKKVDSKRKYGMKVLDESRDGQAKAKQMRDIFAKEKESYDKLKQQKEPEIAKLKARLAELRPKVDAEHLKVYDELVAERKYPAFVEAYSSDKSSYSCRGCGLQLSQSGNSKLLKDGICRCDSCRRVIYLSGDGKKK